MPKLYPYQAEDIERIQTFGGRALLALDMGLGKSRITLEWIAQEQAFPVVIVCPASLKYVWEREAAKWIDTRANVLEGGVKRANSIPTNARIVILNYDILMEVRGGRGGWLDKLKAIDPSTVVIDECHHCAGRTTKRTKAVKELCQGVPHVIALSGTPLLNRPAELFPILSILKPTVFKSFYSYAAQFCRPKLKPWGWTYDGATNLPILHKQLKTTCMMRRQKSEVLKDLPEKIREVVPLPLKKPDEYFKASTDFLGWLKQKNAAKAKAAGKAEAIVRLGELKRMAAKGKFKAATEWIDDFLAETDEKIVLFSWHRKCLEALERRYGHACVTLHGGTPKGKRMPIVDRFQNDKACRIFNGQIQAAGVGLTLTAAQHVAFLELSWRPGDHIQAEDRCYGRINDLHGATCSYLIAKNTIEQDLCEILQEKQNIITQTLDGKPDPRNQLEVFDLLMQRL